MPTDYSDFVHKIRLIDPHMPSRYQVPAMVPDAIAFDDDLPLPTPRRASRTEDRLVDGAYFKQVSAIHDGHVNCLIATIAVHSNAISCPADVADVEQNPVTVYGRKVIVASDNGQPAIRQHEDDPHMSDIDIFVTHIQCEPVD